MDEQVTWLMPIRNGMPYLPEALASIEAQTYRNWEILVWDNGSTDGTLEELRHWIPSRLPGRVIHDNPLSLGDSLAKLVETAQTELCARIDADDINYPTRLEQQVALMRERPNVAVVGTDIEFIDEKGCLIPGAWKQQYSDAEIRWRVRWECPFGHPTVMFRRSVVRLAGNYRDWMPYEDHDLWLRMARIGEMANLPVVLVKYRLTGLSVTGRSSQRSAEELVHRKYDALFDEMAERNADILFSGISQSDAIELRQKVPPRSIRKGKALDLYKLRRAATLSALAVSKPASYFRSTELYQMQQRYLLRQIVQQSNAGRAFLRLKKQVQRWLSSFNSYLDPRRLYRRYKILFVKQ
jgi:glycosyltransferase involved in cell wall biosynthesis